MCKGGIVKDDCTVGWSSSTWCDGGGGGGGRGALRDDGKRIGVRCTAWMQGLGWLWNCSWVNSSMAGGGGV